MGKSQTLTPASSYQTALRICGIGVIRVPPTDNSTGTDTKAPDYLETQAAITKSQKPTCARGAEVVDPLDIPNLKGLVNAAGGGETYEPEPAINAFLAQHPNSPIGTFRELADSNVVNPRRREGLKKGVGHTTEAAISRRCLQGMIYGPLFSRQWPITASTRFSYATYDHAPAAVPKSTPGTNRRLAASLSFPAISVPGGSFADGLPIGLEFLARPFAEGTLIKAAFDYEQATKNRRPPSTVPALPSEP